MALTFLTMTNFGYVKMTENLIRNFHTPFMSGHSLIVECLDNDARVALEPFQSDRVRICSTTILPAHKEFSEFNSVGFLTVTAEKFPLIRHHLEKTAGLFYTDSDIAYFQDPEPFLTGGYDLMIQSDANADHLLYTPFLCSGMMYLQNSPQMLEAIDGVIAYHARNPQGNDQDALNGYLKEKGVVDVRAFSECSIAVLPYKQFLNGHYGFRKSMYRSRDKVAAHANWMIGIDNKVEALMLCGGWYGPDAAAQCRAFRMRRAKRKLLQAVHYFASGHMIKDGLRHCRRRVSSAGRVLRTEGAAGLVERIRRKVGLATGEAHSMPDAAVNLRHNPARETANRVA